MTVPLRPCIFLDRDGVLVELVRDRRRGWRPAWNLAEFSLCPGAVESVHEIRKAGYLAVVVTNQPDVARGQLRDSEARRVSNALHDAIPSISRISHCYHDEPDHCSCRKPKPGMLIEAAHLLGIDLTSSWMIGDRWVDVLAGLRAGCKTVLIDGDHAWSPNSSGEPPRDLQATLVAKNITDAVRQILASNPVPDLKINSFE